MRFLSVSILLPLACLMGLPGLLTASQHKKNEEPKSQVQPLPPEPPRALAAETDSLDFHLSPPLTSGGLSAQIRQSLNDLIRDTRGETIIKLRAFVAGSGDPRRVQAEVIDLFTDHKLPLPVLSILQVGALPNERTQVVIEAVVATHRKANPNGLAFFFGQQGKSITDAFKLLKSNAAAAEVQPERLLSATCFTSRLDEVPAATETLHQMFPNANINFIQGLREPAMDGTNCEAVAQLNKPPADGPVVLMKSARVSLVQSPELIFTTLQLTFGPFLDDAHEAFDRLQKVAASVQPVQTPVEVNAFALDASAAAALRKTISLTPATFTVHQIEGLPAIDASAGIEAILAASVQAAVVVPNRTDDTIHR